MKLLSLILLSFLSLSACNSHEEEPLQQKQEDNHRVQEPVANQGH